MISWRSNFQVHTEIMTLLSFYFFIVIFSWLSLSRETAGYIDCRSFVWRTTIALYCYAYIGCNENWVGDGKSYHLPFAAKLHKRTVLCDAGFSPVRLYLCRFLLQFSPSTIHIWIQWIFISVNLCHLLNRKCVLNAPAQCFLVPCSAMAGWAIFESLRSNKMQFYQNRCHTVLLYVLHARMHSCNGSYAKFNCNWCFSMNAVSSHARSNKKWIIYGLRSIWFIRERVTRETKTQFRPNCIEQNVLTNRSGPTRQKATTTNATENHIDDRIL